MGLTRLQEGFVIVSTLNRSMEDLVIKRWVTFPTDQEILIIIKWPQSLDLGTGILLTLDVRIIDLPPRLYLIELVVSFIAGVVKYALLGY